MPTPKQRPPELLRPKPRPSRRGRRTARRALRSASSAHEHEVVDDLAEHGQQVRVAGRRCEPVGTRGLGREHDLDAAGPPGHGHGRRRLDLDADDPERLWPGPAAMSRRPRSAIRRRPARTRLRSRKRPLVPPAPPMPSVTSSASVPCRSLSGCSRGRRAAVPNWRARNFPQVRLRVVAGRHLDDLRPERRITASLRRCSLLGTTTSMLSACAPRRPCLAEVAGGDRRDAAIRADLVSARRRPASAIDVRDLEGTDGVDALDLHDDRRPGRAAEPHPERNWGESRKSGWDRVVRGPDRVRAQDRRARQRTPCTMAPRSTARGRRRTPRSADGSPSTTTRSAKPPGFDRRRRTGAGPHARPRRSRR